MTTTREAALEAALKDTLDFFERHSNRYDEVNGKHPQTIVEEARAALSTPATEPQGYVVKPLVWKPEDAPCTRFKAEALGGHMMIVELDPETHPGTYSVGVDLGGLCFKFVLAEYDDFPPKYTAPAKFEGIERAKAAAQADYETRVLSAIIGTATPAPSDKIAEAARFSALSGKLREACKSGDWEAASDVADAMDRALAGQGETP